MVKIAVGIRVFFIIDSNGDEYEAESGNPLTRELVLLNNA